IKGIQKLAKMQEENQKQQESQKYLAELQKLKGFLQSKAEQYPDNKQIITDLNIVGKEISNVQARSPEYQVWEKNDETVRLKVNDRDVYEDASRKKEEEKRSEEQSQKSQSFSRGR